MKITKFFNLHNGTEHKNENSPLVVKNNSSTDSISREIKHLKKQLWKFSRKY